MSIGKKIKDLRKAKDIPQGDFAEKINISQSYLSFIESDKKEPTLAVFNKIAAALDTTVGELMGETEPKEKSNIAAIIPLSGKFIDVDVYDLKTCAGFGWDHDCIDVEKIGTESIPKEWIGPVDQERPPFAVIVEGDSMEDAGIISGTYAVINPGAEVSSGEAAMVRYGIDRTVALKRVYRMPGGGIELRSATPGYPVIRYSHDQQRDEDDWCEIMGKIMITFGRPIRG
jgi:transcriptional regulator with XRE-family HTH domain